MIGKYILFKSRYGPSKYDVCQVVAINKDTTNRDIIHLDDGTFCSIDYVTDNMIISEEDAIAFKILDQ